MANMIEFDLKRKLSCYSNFATQSSIVLELMERIFGLVPNNPVNMTRSIIDENWPRFNVISNVTFTVNSPPCLMYLV